MPQTPDPATAYALDVTEGRIVTGELVRLACERHLRDLEEAPARGLFWEPEIGAKVERFISLHHHFKGRWAKAPCTCKVDPSTCERRLRLLPWQQFIVYSVVGWRRYDEELGRRIRRFTIAYAQVSRKQGKTTFALPLSHYLTFSEGEPAAEGYIGATAKHQSRYVHDLAKSLVRASPHLREKIGGHEHKLSNLYAGESFLAPVSSESKHLDALNPYVILLDELHAHSDASLRTVLKTGMGARDEPLLFEITTPGEENEGSICKAERDLGEDVLRGEIPAEESDQWFFYIAELDKGDDWRDISVYVKSNPSMGETVRESELQESLDEALRNPLVRDDHRIKRAGQWLSVFEGMFDAEQWRACDGRLDLKALRGRECFGGLDLAEKIDMGAFALVWLPEDAEDDWKVKLWYWIPEAMQAKRAMKDRQILAWAKAKHVEVTPGARVNFDLIERRVKAAADLYRISEIGFDPWKATQIAGHLEDEGLMMVEVRQGHQTLSAATDELVAVVADGRLNYDNNPVLRWNARNARGRKDANANVIPGKAKSAGRIDGISATITAMSRALAAVNAVSPYEPGAVIHGNTVYEPGA